ncbi:ATP-binding cassette domain-containing protein [Stenotrophomonas maltophilia]
MPFEMIARSIDDVARSWSMLGPLSTLWAAPEEQQVADAQRFAGESGRLEFEQVSHRYGNRRGVSNVSFKAERGSINFLMGPTGAGKSTLLKLALKSIDPQHGRILVDGVDLSRIDRAAWHAAVAVVPQDVILLNESLADNILLGRARDDHRLRHAAGKAAILPLIEALPEGLETTVGERGLKLSGGERQRIAIARALYGEPGILFLDEASSALDEATEREIMGHIRALANDVTVVAITHRRSIVSPTDRVIELESDR